MIERVLCPACNSRAFVQDAPWKLLCVTCYLERKQSKPKALPAAPIEPNMLRRLIQLCHPGRHAGSAAALIATRWLLEVRRAAHG